MRPDLANRALILLDRCPIAGSEAAAFMEVQAALREESFKGSHAVVGERDATAALTKEPDAPGGGFGTGDPAGA